jgi:tetrahydromethanopterin S-methyltransferase subunit G
MAKKTVFFTFVGIVVGLYTTFVLQHLWNWFAATAFHLPQIPFWVMYGMVLGVGMFTLDQSSNFEQRQLFKMLAVGLDACVPADKKELVKDQIEDQKEQMWVEAGTLAFGKLVGNTVTLMIGGVVHLFLA